MLVENIVVESCIANSEARELSGVSIWVLATVNGCLDQPILQQFLVEETSVSAQISNEIADFGSY